MFEDKALRVGPNTITPIIGDKGAKVRKAANIYFSYLTRWIPNFLAASPLCILVHL